MGQAVEQQGGDPVGILLQMRGRPVRRPLHHPGLRPGPARLCAVADGPADRPDMADHVGADVERFGKGEHARPAGLRADRHGQPGHLKVME